MSLNLNTKMMGMALSKSITPQVENMYNNRTGSLPFNNDKRLLELQYEPNLQLMLHYIQENKVSTSAHIGTMVCGLKDCEISI